MTRDRNEEKEILVCLECGQLITVTIPAGMTEAEFARGMNRGRFMMLAIGVVVFAVMWSVLLLVA
ncbi:hypothetical protein [Reyranella sp. CPCC 100927]|uniref:hypothetical protein n=1 Tax=Reyranella sp. CPCC 100927 TaxID=2599616 RepID=UPI0011B5F169|nr:hypothetical protein [Reyranella sp. CPCC 100927]TWT09516.1 hypothetical protein FQU96_20280 [Reyranella sp. CPCC 100927]